jgi:FemAB-related protein (PEP-CTERM system-associated)
MNGFPNLNDFDIRIKKNTPDWLAYLAGHEQSTIYHDPRWGSVLQRACGAEPYYLSASREGKLVGVMTLLGQRSMLFGNRLCSIPYFDASGILADDAGAAEALISAADSLRAREGYRSLEVRQLVPCAEKVPTRTDKVTLWLDLPGDIEALWSQLKTKVRTKIRKVQKNDFDFISGGSELLEDFYDVYSRTMRDLGSPPHGRKIFEEILAEFPDKTRLFVVRRAEKVLAASFTLQDKWGFHVPWSGSDMRFRHLGANRFLYWEMLAYAANIGAKRFDFGRSTVNSGTFEFKLEWGAEPVQLYWHYFFPLGKEMPEVRPDNEKFGLMVKCWKKLPLPAARMLGPWIIRQLS